MVAVARQFRKAPTRADQMLWQALRRDQLGVPVRRQQPIGPFVVDFYIPAGRLVVEVDGPVHDRQQAADAERQRLLEGLGLRFVRLRAEDVERDLPAAVDRIRAALHRALAAGPPSPTPPPTSGGGARGGGPLPVWTATQHLIRALDEAGEQGAADLLARLGAMGEAARDLAYRLYVTADRKGWAQEALAYNSLVSAWPELQRLAAEAARVERPAELW